MTTQHAKSNAREGDGVADDLAVVQAILRDEEGWSGRERQALTAAIAAMQAQQGAEPVAWLWEERTYSGHWVLKIGLSVPEYQDAEKWIRGTRPLVYGNTAAPTTGAPR